MSENTPQDSLNMLQMAQEVHDRMVAEADEKKAQIIYDAEKILRVAEETAATRKTDAEREAATIIEEASKKAREVEYAATEKAAEIEGEARNEYERYRAEVEKLQQFEAEYRDKLIYLLQTSAHTLNLSLVNGQDGVVVAEDFSHAGEYDSNTTALAGDYYTTEQEEYSAEQYDALERMIESEEEPLSRLTEELSSEFEATETPDSVVDLADAMRETPNTIELEEASGAEATFPETQEEETSGELVEYVEESEVLDSEADNLEVDDLAEIAETGGFEETDDDLSVESGRDTRFDAPMTMNGDFNYEHTDRRDDDSDDVAMVVE